MKKPIKIYKTYYIIYSIIFTAFSVFILSTPTSAQDVPTSVTIKPSLGISLSSSDITLNLDPATKPFDSKSITISVGTNNPTGYSLSLNSNSTSLVNISNSSETISTLEESTPESSFPANRWGYRLGNDTTANYLPYSSGTIIGSKNTIASNDTYTLTIASKVDYMKDAGSYRLDLDLKALPIVTQYYMQDLTSSQCTEDPTIVIDKRDEQIYTIRRIGDAGCWMVDNLRFTGTELSSSTSNISSEYTDANPYLVNSGSGYGDLASGNASYEARIHVGVDNHNNPTIWYNYPAASAGTITGNPNTDLQIYDICPRSWRLPTLDEGNALVATLGSGINIFNPVYGGRWYNGALDGITSHGRWWTSTYYDGSNRWILGYLSGAMGTWSQYGVRVMGLYIRCLLQE